MTQGVVDLSELKFVLTEAINYLLPHGLLF